MTPAVSRNMCPRHYKQWDRKYGHLRCHWPGCRQHQDGGGRRMNGRFYCRLHEVEHLRVTPEAERLNLLRLGTNLKGNDKGCWLWYVRNNSGNYGTFVPEGANTAEWLTHRVVWDLLMGGHKPGLELDHRTCKQPPCANPLHLEAVTRSVNQRRKRQGPDVTWRNPEGLETQLVHTFATTFGLPIKASRSSHTPSRAAVRRPPRPLMKKPAATTEGKAWPRAVMKVSSRHRNGSGRRVTT